MKRVRPTANGVVLGVIAIALIITGWQIQSRDLVALGSILAALALIAVAMLLIRRSPKSARVKRTLTGQLMCDRTTQVQTEISSAPGASALRLLYLGDPHPGFAEVTPVISKKASHSGQTGHTAKRGKGTPLSFGYQLQPQAPGHYQVGPTLSKALDPFGLATGTFRLGSPTDVVVWPRIEPVGIDGLAGTSAQRSGVLPTAAADDATLRAYQPGDDLRRIHWPTTARRGTPMVRAAEGRGTTPIQFYLDPQLLTDPSSKRWALEHIGSVGCALLSAGHPVRVLGNTDPEYITCQETGKSQFLNHTAQLASAHHNDDFALGQLRQSKREVATIAVVSPKNKLPAEMNGTNRNAVVVTGGKTAGRDCAAQLKRNGWRATPATPSSSHQRAIMVLTGAAGRGAK